MPYRLDLTWMPHAKKWRKRYLGKTYFLKTRTNGKKDRAGYLAALREWERLKSYINELGPSPYTNCGGELIPDTQQVVRPSDESPSPAKVNGNTRQIKLAKSSPQSDNPFILGSTGFHPELIIQATNGIPHLEERRIIVLIKFWLDHRRKQAERGELSLKQWAEDGAKIKVFCDFMLANFPENMFIDHVNARILNLYRDKQWEFIDHTEKELRIGKATLKKRLDTLCKWLTWLVDQNILAELPKDLRTYGRVTLDKPKPLFWSTDKIKTLATNASERTRLYIMLALNLGYTQKDIATLTNEMIDWETGIVTRERHKTGVPSKAKLWKSTLTLLQDHRNPIDSGPVLVDQNGKPLYSEYVNKNDKLIANDTIRMAFDRVKRAKKTGFKGNRRSFKHLRKSAANEIEKTRPDLTELFLAHAEPGMKRHYVTQHYEKLFVEVAKLEAVYGFDKS